MARSLVCAGTVGGVFSSFAPAAAAPPPASPTALTAGALARGSFAAAAGIAGACFAAARLLFRAGYLLGTWGLRPLSAWIALCLRGAFGAARCGIASILGARPSIATRVSRSVAPHVAISVAVSAVAVPIPVAAAATGAIAIVTRVPTAKPLAMGLGG